MKKLLTALLLLGASGYAQQLTHTATELDEQLDGVYAEIYANNQTNTQAIVGHASNYTIVSNFTANGDSSYCTADYANSKLTITKNGEYVVQIHTSFTGNSANDNWFGAIFAGGVELSDIHFERKIGSGGDYGSAGASGFYSCTNAPVDIDFRIRHDDIGVSVDMTKTYMNLSVYRIGL